MSDIKPNITVNVDVTNPGQFFACCGLLELADRLWPGAEGWFKERQFCIRSSNRSNTIEVLSKAVIDCPSQVIEHGKAPAFELGRPFSLYIDWWRDEIPCDSDHLKTWSGHQVRLIGVIATAIKSSLRLPKDNENLLDIETVPRKADGEKVAPLSFDSGRVGTAQDIGYSPDKISQPIACCVWTEFMSLIALQRFGLKPDPNGFFTFHAWREPLPVCVAAVAARGSVPEIVGCEGRFRLAGRDIDGRYKAFQQATLSEWRSK